VHIDRLKLAHGGNVSDSKPSPRYKWRTRKGEPSVSTEESEQSAAIKIGAGSLAHQVPRQDGTPPNREVHPCRLHALDSSSPSLQDTVTPTAERADHTHRPGDSPRSRRELEDTRAEPPLTRSRARSVRDEHASLE